MKRTLESLDELSMAFRADGKRASLSLDLSHLTRPERQFLLQIVGNAGRNVQFGAFPTDDGRTRLEITLGKPIEVSTSVASELRQ